MFYFLGAKYFFPTDDDDDFIPVGAMPMKMSRRILENTTPEVVTDELRRVFYEMSKKSPS